MSGTDLVPLLKRVPEHPADDPTLSTLIPDRVSNHVALGFRVRLETNDPRIAGAAEPILGPEREVCGESSEIVMRLLVHPVDEPVGWQALPPVIREQLGLFSVTASRATFVHGDSERGTLAGFISPTVADMSEYLQSCIVQSAFLIAINLRVAGAVHTACVVKDGRSLMVRGTPGAGKSTTAYIALRTGLLLVGEDVVFPRQASAGAPFTLHGVPWMLYLMPDAVRFFPELEGIEPVERSNGERKLGVRVAERFPGQVVEQAPLGPSVFLERSTDGSTRLLPLEREEFMARLQATSIEFERRAARDFGLWDAMLEHPAYRLQVGPDPFEAAEHLLSILERG